jgi:hypothetical protein
VKRALALAAATTIVCGAATAGATEPVSLEGVLSKLAASAARFETDLKKASYTVEGHIETVDRDGSTSDHKEGAFHVRPEGREPRFEVLRYTEDGENKIDEARKKASESSRKKSDDDEVHMPFLASEQPKYVFHLRETDAADPARVRVGFVPKRADKHLVVGSAWVDTRTGDVLSMGVAPSKTELFVDYLHVTLEFGERMGEGRSVSKIVFEGSGGILLFHRKFRGAARLFGYRVP